MPTHLNSLPPDLPVPQDDGAARHLTGLELPDVRLALAGGGHLDLREVAEGTLVAFIYPRTGTPLVPDWDDIPGARGCTPQSCAFREHHDQLASLGATVIGISSMDIGEQQAFAEREHLPYALVNDSELVLARSLRLPTFEAAGVTLLKRLTFVAREGRIEHVFYPVFPPDRNAADVAAWLSRAAA